MKEKWEYKNSGEVCWGLLETLSIEVPATILQSLLLFLKAILSYSSG